MGALLGIAVGDVDGPLVDIADGVAAVNLLYFLSGISLVL